MLGELDFLLRQCYQVFTLLNRHDHWFWLGHKSEAYESQKPFYQTGISYEAIIKWVLFVCVVHFYNELWVS